VDRRRGAQPGGRLKSGSSAKAACSSARRAASPASS
jgi:hypothetical protein